MQRTIFYTAFIVLAIALAGCTGGNTTTTTSTPSTTTEPTLPTDPVTTTPVTSTPPVETPTITNDTFTVETSTIPAILAPGQEFSFSVFVNGTQNHTTDHVGAHYGATSTTTPSTTVYDQACVHGAGNLPGSFLVNCSLPTEGTWYLRGHARVTVASVAYNYWGLERVVNVSAYNVTIDAPPTNVIANQTVTYKVNVTGNFSRESQHVGSHWSWNSSATAAPTTTLYERTCGHIVATAPGVVSVTCEFPSGGLTPTKIYLRGHIRFTDGAAQTNYWSQEYELTVTGIL